VGAAGYEVGRKASTGIGPDANLKRHPSGTPDNDPDVQTQAMMEATKVAAAWVYLRTYMK
jgi:hypothetical protein